MQEGMDNEEDEKEDDGNEKAEEPSDVEKSSG